MYRMARILYSATCWLLNYHVRAIPSRLVWSIALDQTRATVLCPFVSYGFTEPSTSRIRHAVIGLIAVFQAAIRHGLDKEIRLQSTKGWPWNFFLYLNIWIRLHSKNVFPGASQGGRFCWVSSLSQHIHNFRPNPQKIKHFSILYSRGHNENIRRSIFF